MTLTLNNPLTEEEWDLIEDVDFDKTNSIEFHTKHGKTVKFVKCTDERTGDLISRQAAVDEFPEDALPWDTFDGYIAPHHVRKILKQLPSVQPKHNPEFDGTESNIETLSKLRATFNCFDELEEPCYRALSDAIQALTAQPETHEEHTETHVCDCISRKGAIDTLFKILDKLNHADFLYADEIYKALNELPPVQPYTTGEIIHCKDCIHAGHNLALQVNWCNNREWFRTVNPYDFCSWAERREE